MIHFHSHLAEQMQQFVAFKHMQNYDYTSQAQKLSGFDKFLAKGDKAQQFPYLSPEILRQYVEEDTAHLQRYSRRNHLSPLREFSCYLHARDPRSAILPKDIVPRSPRPVRFYRITPQQASNLMDATRQVLHIDEFQAYSISVFIGLLYSTGLRLNEALMLTLGDVDASNAMLHVSKGKFDKQRLVPMSPTTLSALKRYLVIRNQHAEDLKASPLFARRDNKALTRKQVYYAFCNLCRHCGLNSKPRPRLHDLRHNYACRRLALWREQGCDVNTMLPVLATAMGHVDIINTQIYLHIDSSELHDVAKRLNTYLERPR
jgi:site-specific recombinase XerD